MGAGLSQGWSFEPLAALAIALAAWHEIGLRRLLGRTRADRRRARRLRSLWFYAGVAVVLLAVVSPLEQRGYEYFYVRTVQHLLLMFAAPVMIVAGAPWQPLLLALPLRLRRRGLRWLLHDEHARSLRAAIRLLGSPLFAIGLFNVVMVGFLLPSVFDLTERIRPLHVWLVNGGMLLSGVLFWLLIVRSPPLRVYADPAIQVIALLITNGVMWVLAIAMTLFSSQPWYSVYAHVPHASLSPLGDQQVGAGILWVCGDLWAVPPLVLAAYRLVTREAEVLESALARLAGIRDEMRLGPERSRE